MRSKVPGGERDEGPSQGPTHEGAVHWRARGVGAPGCLREAIRSYRDSTVTPPLPGFLESALRW